MPRFLADLVTPLEPLTFPSGREYPIRPVGPAEVALARELAAGTITDPLELLETYVRILKGVAPDAPEDELRALTWPYSNALIEYASGRLNDVYAELKNGDAGQVAGAPTTRPSTPSTPKNTSSPASGDSRAATGGTSGVSLST